MVSALVLFSIVIASTIPWTVPHTISTILTSAALAVLVALTIIVDIPFEGETAAQPTELRYVLGQMAERQNVIDVSLPNPLIARRHNSGCHWVRHTGYCRRSRGPLPRPVAAAPRGCDSYQTIA